MDILLVEDNPGDIRLTLETFRDANPNIRLHLANDGAEALALSYWI
jgi:chemotaxis family two-component system response regulator Rcp1